MSTSAQILAGTSTSNADVTGCENFGPQTPRNIDSTIGENTVTFNPAPSYENMNLCNIHFHKNAEHMAKAFSIVAQNNHGGYQCNISKSLSQAELTPTADTICSLKSGNLKPGDTIEVHYVHTSCNVKPGPTLGACVSNSCANPDLRVETQVFTLVNDTNALNFMDLQQAKALPQDMGKPVQFLGSTTGPSFSNEVCSPYQVTWSVRPKCAKLDINSVGEWCKGNVFNEDHAHGVRKLVTDPTLLSIIN
jgi:hypothetical protein